MASKLSSLREGSKPLESTIRKVSGDAPLADVVYDALEHALRRGEFTPGQSLKIRPLADALGTSQTPVREALSRLVAQKVLEFHPVNRSVLVPRLGADDVREIYAIRQHLERLAMEAVARTITRKDLRRLTTLRKAVEQSARANSARRFLHDNEVFLFTIYELAGLPRVLDMIRGLWLQIGPTMGVLLADTEDIPALASLDTYRELIAAFGDRDIKKVGQLIEQRLALICDKICDRLA